MLPKNEIMTKRVILPFFNKQSLNSFKNTMLKSRLSD
jgi:hypothetical protein